MNFVNFRFRFLSFFRGFFDGIDRLSRCSGEVRLRGFKCFLGLSLSRLYCVLTCSQGTLECSHGGFSTRWGVLRQVFNSIAKSFLSFGGLGFDGFFKFSAAVGQDGFDLLSISCRFVGQRFEQVRLQRNEFLRIFGAQNIFSLAQGISQSRLRRSQVQFDQLFDASKSLARQGGECFKIGFVRCDKLFGSVLHFGSLKSVINRVPAKQKTKSGYLCCSAT